MAGAQAGDIGESVSTQPVPAGRSFLSGGLPHSDRRRAGAEPFHGDAAVAAYCTRFPTLADLYQGTGLAEGVLWMPISRPVPSAPPQQPDRRTPRLIKHR